MEMCGYTENKIPDLTPIAIEHEGCFGTVDK